MKHEPANKLIYGTTLHDRRAVLFAVAELLVLSLSAICITRNGCERTLSINTYFNTPLEDSKVQFTDIYAAIQ